MALLSALVPVVAKDDEHSGKSAASNSTATVRRLSFAAFAKNKQKVHQHAASPHNAGAPSRHKMRQMNTGSSCSSNDNCPGMQTCVFTSNGRRLFGAPQANAPPSGVCTAPPPAPPPPSSPPYSQQVPFTNSNHQITSTGDVVYSTGGTWSNSASWSTHWSMFGGGVYEWSLTAVQGQGADSGNSWEAVIGIVANYDTSGAPVSTSWDYTKVYGFISESGDCPSSYQPDLSYTCSGAPGSASEGDVVYFKYDSSAGTLDVRLNSATGPYTPLASGIPTSSAYYMAVSSYSPHTWRLHVV